MAVARRAGAVRRSALRQVRTALGENAWLKHNRVLRQPTWRSKPRSQAARCTPSTPYRPRAVAAEYRATDDMLAIKLATGVELLMPRKLLQGLEDADPQEVANVEIDDFGEGLHWEALDVDHYVPSLLESVFGNRRWMSELGKRGGSVRNDAKTRAARKNGRKGGRPPPIRANERIAGRAPTSPNILRCRCRPGVRFHAGLRRTGGSVYHQIVRLLSLRRAARRVKRAATSRLPTARRLA